MAHITSTLLQQIFSYEKFNTSQDTMCMHLEIVHKILILVKIVFIWTFYHVLKPKSWPSYKCPKMCPIFKMLDLYTVIIFHQWKKAKVI